MDFQFLDFSDLTEVDKNRILNILKSKIIEGEKFPWVFTEKSANFVTVSEAAELQQHHWYNVMQPAPAYPQQIIPQMCNDWQPPMYNVPANGHMPSFMPGMAYPHPAYNLGAEIQDMSYNRDNERRNNRGRNMRKDIYNRALNPVNEVQSGYMGDQAQFHPQMSIMYIYPEHLVSTQHQVAAGQIYYQPPMYSSIPHPHPNTQPISPTQLVHSTYPPVNHQLQSMNRSIRQSQPIISQPYSEPIKAKSHDKRIQNTYVPEKSECHINKDNHNSSQTSIISTPIINNPISESPVKKVDESTANKINVTNKIETEMKKQLKIQQTKDITKIVNKNCNGTEKTDVSCTNNIKISQNGETDKKIKDETGTSIPTTIVVETSFKAIPVKVDKSEVQITENCAPKDVRDKTSNNSSTTPNGSSDTPNGSSATLNGSSAAPNGSSATPNGSSATLNESTSCTPSPVSITSPSAIQKRTYASLFKKNTESASTISNQNGSSNTSSPKESKSSNSTPEKQNDSTSTSKPVQNGILQMCYDDPNTFKMGEFLLGYKLDKQTVSLLPRGLANRNNYCYINSILQALMACPPFYNLLQALPFPKIQEKDSSTPLIDNMVRFTREFTPLAEAARMPRKDRSNKRARDMTIDIHSGAAFEPSYVYTMLKNTSGAGAFSVEGRQEDAEEFLSCLLNGINDEMVELMKVANNYQNAIATTENISDNHEEWKIMGPKNKGAVTRSTEFERTPLSDIFRGQLRSRVSRAGEQPTDNVQPFFTLQLDIQKADSVKTALDILVGKDQLEGMTCSKTRQQIEAWKQVTLEELPAVLILHLKWFVYKFDKHSNGCSKVLKSMEFPIDLKIDGKLLSPNTAKKLGPKQKQYKLFAVTYHDGKETTKGHYFTDAFHVGYGTWVRYDDSTVKGIPESSVLRPPSPRVPYLLYYRRCDTIGNQLNGVKVH